MGVRSGRVHGADRATMGQCSMTRERALVSGVNVRVRQDTISVTQPVRLRAARSRSVGPSISMRSAFMCGSRLASRQARLRIARSYNVTAIPAVATQTGPVRPPAGTMAAPREAEGELQDATHRILLSGLE